MPGTLPGFNDYSLSGGQRLEDINNFHHHEKYGIGCVYRHYRACPRIYLMTSVVESWIEIQQELQKAFHQNSRKQFR
jgi:hypothetical protein